MNKTEKLIERFMNKVSKDKTTGCWIWTGWKKNGNLYGYFSLTHSKKVRANRQSYEFFIGKIPDGEQVLHRCDNPQCVNPHHLFLGSHQDNMDDRKTKGRYLKGSKWCRSKLTEKNVLKIKQELINNVHGIVAKLARKYNIGWTAIYDIKTGRTWSHV